MARVALFGGGYIYNLQQYCRGNLNVSSDIAVTYKFFAYPDLRVDHVPFGHIEEMLEFLPNAIIISLGENDITKGCVVNNIVGKILMLVKIFKSAGVQTVFMLKFWRRDILEIEKLSEKSAVQYTIELSRARKLDAMVYGYKVILVSNSQNIIANIT